MPGQFQMLETQSLTKLSLGSHKPVVQRWSTEMFVITEGCEILMETQRRDRGKAGKKGIPDRGRVCTFGEQYLIWCGWDDASKVDRNQTLKDLEYHEKELAHFSEGIYRTNEEISTTEEMWNYLTCIFRKVLMAVGTTDWVRMEVEKAVSKL